MLKLQENLFLETKLRISSYLHPKSAFADVIARS
jgi:hypothetical protein